MRGEIDYADLISTSRACKLAGVHVQTLYRWIRSGRLACWRLVGRLRVSERELRQLMESRAVPGVPGAKAGRPEGRQSGAAEELRARGW